MLPDARRHGPAGILFLDEINAAPPTVSAAAYQFILDRRLGEYVIPEGWAIFAAGNRQGDRGVTYAMPAPLANRFTHYDVEANLDDWIELGAEQRHRRAHSRIPAVPPRSAVHYDAAHNPVAFPSPRSWEYAHRALQKFGDRPDLLSDACRPASASPAASN
jgi:MoxR-like ATPase